jgi:lauroyl/myristoyl acyltransferase
MRILDLDAGVMGELRSLLNQGELVALVADRDLSKSGIDVNFFGARARMPAGPAILALETGADLVTVFVSYVEDGIVIDCAPPIKVDKGAERKAEIARVTQVMANRFEDAIKVDPTSCICSSASSLIAILWSENEDRINLAIRLGCSGRSSGSYKRSCLSLSRSGP